MRLNKEIAQLTEDAPGVEWPKTEPQSFQRFARRLHEVLKANDISARGMEFDEYSGHFYWTENFSIRIADLPGTFERTCIVDPKLPIADEISRLLRERDAIQEVANDVAREFYAKQQIAKQQIAKAVAEKGLVVCPSCEKLTKPKTESEPCTRCGYTGTAQEQP